MSDKKKDSTKKDEKDSDDKLENLEYSKKIGDYILFDQIGMGTFSKVTRAYHLITNQTVAVKILDKEKIEDEIDIERIIREIEILKNIHHPNIAQMYETYSTIHNFYLMIEYVSGGDLFDYITSHNYLSEKKSCFFFRQIISVLEYLIELGISHRDIKPENILLDESHTKIKFIDFGLSNYCTQNELLHSSCGSPCYASPEMLSGRAYRGTTTDLWSAGIVLYSMLVGALPFDDQELHKLYEQIKIGKFYIPSTLSLEAIDLLKKILEVDPKKRINIEGVKNHKWFQMEENPMYKGINISIEHFPCDTKVVSYVIKNYFKEDKEISMSMLVKMIHVHECNRYTATYYLVKSNILGIEEKFKIRKDKKKIEENKNNKTNENKSKNTENNKNDNDNNKNSKKNINKEKEKEKGKNHGINILLDGIINKKNEEINTRNKNNEIIEFNNKLGNSQNNENIFYFTGNTEEENQKLRSKTEEDVNTFFNNKNADKKKENNDIKISNDDNIFIIKEKNEKKHKNSNEDLIINKNSIKNNNKNNNNNNKVNNSKKKSSKKEHKKSSKKNNNNEIRTGKIAIPILNIKKYDNGIKFEEKCNTERANNNNNNSKKRENSKNNNQNKNNLNIHCNNNNNLKNSKGNTKTNVSNNNKIDNKNMNQLIIKNSSKNKIKKNKTNSPKSTNNLNFYVINNIINKDNGKNGGIYITEKDVQNRNIGANINRNTNPNGNPYGNGTDIPASQEQLDEIISEKKKVFDKIKVNFNTNRDYKYAKSPSDINLITKNSNNNSNNSNNQIQLYKTSNNNEFNEAVLFSNRIKFKNSSIKNNKNSTTYYNNNLFMRTSNNIPDKINIKKYDIFSNPINKNILLYDNNISNNIIINQKNNMSINSQNKKNDKKKNLNIFSNYINQKNIYNIFNNDYSKNQTHQRNFKSALKYQLTEFKTENRVIANNFCLPKKKVVSRNKKSSYNKEYNTNYVSKNKNNNIIKEYTTKYLNNNNNNNNNNNQKHANSIDDSKNNFSSTPKYIDKIKNTKEHKKYFLNIDYLFKSKNKKNKLILTSTIGNSNNSPKNAYNIGQNYFGIGFHTDGNVKNNSTNKNKDNLSIVLKKGIIRNQKKVNKDIFNLNIKERNRNNNSEQKTTFNNSNNINPITSNNINRKNRK
jgi:5'-AMP-activated protein kinase catalytic alpha subunit